MRIPFRQGIVQCNLSSFLNVTSSYVDLLATVTPFVVTIAGGTTDYVHVEHQDVLSAWGPIPANTDTWLYIDVNKRTGIRTFGFTLTAPWVSSSAPSNPAANSAWYDTQAHICKVWSGTEWVTKARVYIAKLDNSAITVSLSDRAPSFIGTQVGDNSVVYAGQILFGATNLPIKDEAGAFITTEDKLRTRILSTADVKAAGLVTEAIAEQNLARYTIVRFSDFGKIIHATAQTVALPGQFGIIESDTVIGAVVNVVTDGVISNIDWDWTPFGVNTLLYCDDAGALTTTQSVPSQVPVATVIDKHSIQVGSPRTNVNTTVQTTTNPPTPIMTTTVQGKAKINIPPVNLADPIVVGVNDPRMTDARVPLPHTHPLSDITDVEITAATNGQVLTYDGAGLWVNRDVPQTGGGDSVWNVLPRVTAVTTAATALTDYALRVLPSLEAGIEDFASVLDMTDFNLELDALPPTDTLTIRVFFSTVKGVYQYVERTYSPSDFTTLGDYVGQINLDFSSHVSAALSVTPAYSSLIVTSANPTYVDVGLDFTQTDPIIIAATNTTLMEPIQQNVVYGAVAGTEVSANSVQVKSSVNPSDVYVNVPTIVNDASNVADVPYWVVTLDSSQSDPAINDPRVLTFVDGTAVKTVASSISIGAPVDKWCNPGPRALYTMGNIVDQTIQTYVEVRHIDGILGGKRIKGTGDECGRAILSFQRIQSLATPDSNTLGLTAGANALSGLQIIAGEGSSGEQLYVSAILQEEGYTTPTLGVIALTGDLTGTAWFTEIAANSVGSGDYALSFRLSQNCLHSARSFHPADSNYVNDAANLNYRLTALTAVDWVNTTTSAATYGFAVVTLESTSGAIVNSYTYNFLELVSPADPLMTSFFINDVQHAWAIGYGDRLLMEYSADETALTQRTAPTVYSQLFDDRPASVRITSICTATDPVQIESENKVLVVAGTAHAVSEESRNFIIVVKPVGLEFGKVAWKLNFDHAFRPQIFDGTTTSRDDSQVPVVTTSGDYIYFACPVERGQSSAIFVAALHMPTRTVKWTREIGKVDSNSSNAIPVTNVTNPPQQLTSSGVSQLIEHDGKLTISFTCVSTDETLGTIGSTSVVAQFSSVMPAIGVYGDNFEIMSTTKQLTPGTIGVAAATDELIIDANNPNLDIEIARPNDIGIGFADDFPRETHVKLAPFNDAVRESSLTVHGIATVDELVLRSTSPRSKYGIGTPGDMPGLIVRDDTGIHVCNAAYDGLTNIWKHINFSASGEMHGSSRYVTNYPNGAVGDRLGDVRYLGTSDFSAGGENPTALMCIRDVTPDTIRESNWIALSTPGNPSGAFLGSAWRIQETLTVVDGELRNYGQIIKHLMDYNVAFTPEVQINVDSHGHVCLVSNGGSIVLPGCTSPTITVPTAEPPSGWYTTVVNASKYESSTIYMTVNGLTNEVTLLPGMTSVFWFTGGSYRQLFDSAAAIKRKAFANTTLGSTEIVREDAGTTIRATGTGIQQILINVELARDYVPGMEVTVRNVSADVVALLVGVTTTLNVPQGKQPRTSIQGGEIRLHYVGNDEWDVSGDLTDL